MKIYTVDGHAWTENEIDEMLEYIIDNYDFHDAYNDFLDCEGPITVAGHKFYPSEILENCDNIAYECGYDNFLDFERRNFSDNDEYFLDAQIFSEDAEDFDPENIECSDDVKDFLHGKIGVEIPF